MRRLASILKFEWILGLSALAFFVPFVCMYYKSYGHWMWLWEGCVFLILFILLFIRLNYLISQRQRVVSKRYYKSSATEHKQALYDSECWPDMVTEVGNIYKKISLRRVKTVDEEIDRTIDKYKHFLSS